MATTQLWFIRHGEVAAPYAGGFVGTTDVPLSDLGRHQAEAIAAYLEDAPIDAVVCTHRRRSLDTAAPLARVKGVRLDVRKGLAEMDYGAWEGLHWPQIVERDPQFAERWQAEFEELPCPGGECGRTFAERVHASLQEVLDEHRGRTVAVVAHAGTNRAILAHIMRRPFADAFVFAQDYGCLNAAAFTPQRAQVALLNFVPGPRSHHPGD